MEFKKKQNFNINHNIFEKQYFQEIATQGDYMWT